jgi:hypothetical protein
MLKWLLARKIKAKVVSDLADAQAMLAMMKLKLQKEGAQATIACGEGVGEVAGLLANRFGVSVPAALEARGLDWRKLSDAADDLLAGLEKAGSLVKGEVQSVRTSGQTHAFGCLVLYHLYRLRFLTTQASGEQQAEVRAMAERVAAFARVMAGIAVGVQEPSAAQE